MTYDPQIHRRRSIRLPGYDYTQDGSYFVTISTKDHECLFGHVLNGQVMVNHCGKLVVESWEWLAERYPYVRLDEWVLMPNHLHGILVITDDRRGGSRTAPTEASAAGFSRKTLGRLVGAFKTVSTKKINEFRATPGTQVWQRNFYEHVIRSESSLQAIRTYIINNPGAWESDELYSLN